MRLNPDQIGFIPVKAEHYLLLRNWLGEPHIQEWWGDPEEELGFIHEMVEGRDSTRPFLILLESVPVGYIQYWFVAHHQSEQWTRENPWLLELPEETVGVDLSIGCPDKLSQGIGSAALAAFASMLRSQGYATIIIDPDRRNGRAVRAYTKAGFRPVPQLKGRTGDVLIMQYDPNVSEIA